MKKRSYFDEPKSPCEGLCKYLVAGTLIAIALISSNYRAIDRVEQINATANYIGLDTGKKNMNYVENRKKYFDEDKTNGLYVLKK